MSRAARARPGAARVPARLRARFPPDVLGVIAAGGIVGALARYEIAQVIHVRPGGFPWATFVTNVTGSFLMGLLGVVLLERLAPSRYVRPLLTTGFLGAFTTYSTFAVEADLLVRDGHALVGLAYVVATASAGLVAVWAGMACARALPRRKGVRR